MNIEWNKIEYKNKELFDSYYKQKITRSCELCFANNYLWSPHYAIYWGIVEDCLVFWNAGSKAIQFPIGLRWKEAILYMEEWFREKDLLFKMQLVTADQFALLEELSEGKYQIEYDRGVADYLYETQSLITLTGKKLHSKRNHINRFCEQYPDWTYETLNQANEKDCFEMAEKWREENLCTENSEKKAEFCVTLNAIKMREKLGLVGGVIRANGKVVAFSLGEPLTQDTFGVHIEKAFAGIQGAYPMINREFVAHEAAAYRYTNREEDTGAEGLRKAKLSYEPIILLEKGTVSHR